MQLRVEGDPIEFLVQGDEVVYHVHIPSVGGFSVAAPRPADASTLGLTMAHDGDGGARITHLAGGTEIGSGALPQVPPGIIDTNAATAGQNSRSDNNSVLAFRHGRTGAAAIRNSITNAMGRAIESK